VIVSHSYDIGGFHVISINKERGTAVVKPVCFDRGDWCLNRTEYPLDELYVTEHRHMEIRTFLDRLLDLS
jgi:hypothetical protein